MISLPELDRGVSIRQLDLAMMVYRREPIAIRPVNQS